MNFDQTIFLTAHWDQVKFIVTQRFVLPLACQFNGYTIPYLTSNLSLQVINAIMSHSSLVLSKLKWYHIPPVTSLFKVKFHNPFPSVFSRVKCNHTSPQQFFSRDECHNIPTLTYHFKVYMLSYPTLHFLLQGFNPTTSHRDLQPPYQCNPYRYSPMGLCGATKSLLLMYEFRVRGCMLFTSTEHANN